MRMDIRKALTSHPSIPMHYNLNRGRIMSLQYGATPRRLNTIIVVIITILNSGCAVGPDFKRPEAPAVTHYTNEPLPEETSFVDADGGTTQKIGDTHYIPAQWWKLFRSETLNQIVEEAINANPNIEAALATLRQARETLYASYSGFFPSFDLNGGATREQVSGGSFGNPFAPNSIFTLYNASVNVTYTFDFFGGIRRQVESLQAQANYQNFQYEATYLTLVANVVTAAIQEVSLREQIAETQKIIAIEKRQLGVLQDQFRLRAISITPVLLQRATLAQVQANLASLKKQQVQRYDQLAILCGRFPGEKMNALTKLSSLHLPEDLPLSLPSDLVRQRPDIRSAEEQLHAASAQVGIATAAMLPQITLNGSYGSQAVAGTDTLFTPASSIWNIGGAVMQPLFHGGQLLHQRRAAVAGYDKALAQYKNTVLTAFQNVADTLAALQYDADALVAQVDGAYAATRGMDVAQTQFKAGIIGYLSMLDTERTFEQARIGMIQAQASRYADTAALFQALGGGWWNSSSGDMLNNVKYIKQEQESSD